MKGIKDTIIKKKIKSQRKIARGEERNYKTARKQ